MVVTVEKDRIKQVCFVFRYFKGYGIWHSVFDVSA